MMGWSVIAQMQIRRERWPGGQRAAVTPLVAPGQNVFPDQPVMRLEATVMPQTMAGSSLPSAAETARQSSEVVAAGLRGRVVEITPRGGVVIEGRAAVVRGALGAGRQVAGILTLWRPAETPNAAFAIPPSAILVVPGPINLAFLRQAMASGVAGVVASSLSLPDLEGFLNADVIELLHSASVEATQMRLPPLTLMLTEGPGTFAMSTATTTLLTHYQGSIALLSGATSVRRHITPDLLISLPLAEEQEDWQPITPEPAIAPGMQVRVCSGDYEGALGSVAYLFTHDQVFLSGIRAPAACLLLENNTLLVVPLALIERIS
jgi:hypothetical protein